MKKVGFFCVFGFVKERKVLFCVFCFGFYFLEFCRGYDMAVFLVRLLSRKGRSFFGFFLCVMKVPGTMLTETEALAKLASYGSMNIFWSCVNNGGKYMNFFIIPETSLA